MYTRWGLQKPFREWKPQGDDKPRLQKSHDLPQVESSAFTDTSQTAASGCDSDGEI